MQNELVFSNNLKENDLDKEILIINEHFIKIKDYYILLDNIVYIQIFICRYPTLNSLHYSFYIGLKDGTSLNFICANNFEESVTPKQENESIKNVFDYFSKSLLLSSKISKNTPYNKAWLLFDRYFVNMRFIGYIINQKWNFEIITIYPRFKLTSKNYSARNIKEKDDTVNELIKNIENYKNEQNINHTQVEMLNLLRSVKSTLDNMFAFDPNNDFSNNNILQETKKNFDLLIDQRETTKK